MNFVKIKISSPNIKMKPKIKCNTFCRCIFYTHVMKLPKLVPLNMFSPLKRVWLYFLVLICKNMITTSRTTFYVYLIFFSLLNQLLKQIWLLEQNYWNKIINNLIYNLFVGYWILNWKLIEKPTSTYARWKPSNYQDP